VTFAQPFSNYEILARIGAGAMGTVFKARQKHMNRIVALKVLKPSLARDARFVERLQREARIVGKLNHPNIVTGYDLGQEGGYHFFVMEFVEGRSLRQLLHEWGMFPEEQVLDVAIQTAGALAHAFECGVIHRDIKPANILIDQDGRVKLTDMGLAKVETDLQLTREGATVGTPQYISPEQARDPRSADVRSDMYSLGATLFHMATGQPPFRAESIGELITKVLHERPASAVALNPALSDGLSLLIRKLLSKDPGLRYQTPQELLLDLERVRRRERPQVDPAALDADPAIESVAEVAGEVRPRGRTRLRRAGLRLGLGLALVALGFVLGGRGRGGGAPVGDRAAEAAALEQRLAAAPTRRARFRTLDEARREGLDPALVDRLELALEAEVGAELAAVIDGWLGPRRAELEAWLREPAHWRDPGAFVREVAVPELRARFDLAPEQLPTLGLRRVVTDGFARLSVALQDGAAARDEEFAYRHARYLRDELRAGVLELAAQGDFAAARRRLSAAAAPFFGQDGRPTEDQLPAEFAGRLREAEAVAVRAIEAELRDAQRASWRALRTEAEVGLEALGRLRDDIRAEGGSLRPLVGAFEDLERRLGARRSAGTDLAGADLADRAEDPWPEIDAELRGLAAEIDALVARRDEQRLEAELALAYAVLGEAGPHAARLVVDGAGPGSAEPAARRGRHAAAIAAAAELVEALLAAAPAGGLPTVDGGAAQRLRIDPHGAGLVDPDGRRIGVGGIDWVTAVDGLPAAARARLGEAAGLGRALLLLCQREPAAALAGLGTDARAFVEAEVWPRVRAANALPPAAAEVDARAVLRALLRARDAGEVDAVRTGLADFRARFADGPVAQEARFLLKDLDDWLLVGERRAELAAVARQRVPAGFRIEVRDDGGSVRATARAPELGAEAGRIGFLVRDGRAGFDEVRSGETRAILPLPMLEPILCRAGIELRLPRPRGTEAVGLALVLGDLACVVVVLPLGHVAATLLDSPAVLGQADELQRALSAPLVAAVGRPPRAIAGAWHRVGFEVERRRGGAVEVVLRWDGPDGEPLLVARRSSAGSAGELALVPMQPLELRTIELECRPGSPR
jgi:serine/threonine-protein kinase